MSSMQLALILGPFLAFALLIGYLTRNDPITTKSIEQVQQRPLNRLFAVISCVPGPVAVLLLLNNLFGAFMLVISGAVFFFQEKLFADVFWIRGIAAKLVGLIYFLIGALLVFQHVPSI